MTDHRRIQRTLFRMQHDPVFASALRARDAGALASTGLAEADLVMLLAASAASIEADAGGRRRAQFLRNVASEHALTLARAAGGADPLLLESFTASEHFHGAIREDRRLPLAFASHALERARVSGDAFLAALALLEGAMCRARRGPFERVAAPPGGLVLGPRADVLELPEGSVFAAGELRRALDEGEPRESPALPDGAREHVLILAGGAESPHRLADATLEVLSPLAGALLSLARTPLTAEGLRAFCVRHEVTGDEVGGFLEDLVAEGIVIRG